MFWEKEPKIKNQRAAGYKYRAKGKIKFDAIAAMTERLNAIAISDELLAARDEAERQFTHSTEGMTAYRHDRAARELRKLAKELLTERPDLSLADIAVQCGYRDYNYFINVFTQAAGISPGAFRRRDGTIPPPLCRSSKEHRKH